MRLKIKSPVKHKKGALPSLSCFWSWFFITREPPLRNQSNVTGGRHRSKITVVEAQGKGRSNLSVPRAGREAEEYAELRAKGS